MAKVLHVSFHSPHLMGSYNRTLGRYLRSNASGSDVVVSCGPAAEVDPAIASKVYFTNGGGKSFVGRLIDRIRPGDEVRRYSRARDPFRARYADEVERFIAELSPDVVVVYDDVKLALRLSRLRPRDFSLVFSQHGTRYELSPVVEVAFYSPGTLDGVVVLSAAARRLIERLPSAHGLRVEVQANAVECDLFVPLSEAERGRLREELHLSGGPVLLYVGRLVPQKGVGDAIEVLSRVRRSAAGAQLLVAGHGPDEYQRELRSLARDLTLEGSIRFLGPVDQGQAQRLYGCADLVLFPTRVPEGMPKVVLEALSCGCPVVGYDFASRPDIGGPEEGLIAVDPGDVEALAQETGRVLVDQHLLDRLGERGRQAMLARFSFDEWCDRHAALGQSFATHHTL